MITSFVGDSVSKPPPMFKYSFCSSLNFLPRGLVSETTSDSSLASAIAAGAVIF
jgi:hypothetical protein